MSWKRIELGKLLVKPGKASKAVFGQSSVSSDNRTDAEYTA